MVVSIMAFLICEVSRHPRQRRILYASEEAFVDYNSNIHPVVVLFRLRIRRSLSGKGNGYGEMMVNRCYYE